jgi:phage-related protein
MPDYPTIILTPQWNASQRQQIQKYSLQLGDGYVQTAIGGTRPITEEWQIKRTAKTEQIDSIQVELETLAGVDAFFWQPTTFYPANLYVCSEWSKTPIGEDLWEFSTTFTRWYPDVPIFQGGQCDAEYRVTGQALYTPLGGGSGVANFLTINCPTGIYGPVSVYWKNPNPDAPILWSVWFRGKDISGNYTERSVTNTLFVAGGEMGLGPIVATFYRCDGLPDDCG